MVTVFRLLLLNQALPIVQSGHTVGKDGAVRVLLPLLLVVLLGSHGILVVALVVALQRIVGAVVGLVNRRRRDSIAVVVTRGVVAGCRSGRVATTAVGRQGERMLIGRRGRCYCRGNRCDTAYYGRRWQGHRDRGNDRSGRMVVVV